MDIVYYEVLKETVSVMSVECGRDYVLSLQLSFQFSYRILD